MVGTTVCRSLAAATGVSVVVVDVASCLIESFLFVGSFLGSLIAFEIDDVVCRRMDEAMAV